MGIIKAGTMYKDIQQLEMKWDIKGLYSLKIIIEQQKAEVKKIMDKKTIDLQPRFIEYTRLKIADTNIILINDSINYIKAKNNA